MGQLLSKKEKPPKRKRGYSHKSESGSVSRGQVDGDDARDGKLAPKGIHLGNQVNCLCAGERANTVVSGGERAVVVFDVLARRETQRWGDGHTGSINQVVAHDQAVYSASRDRSICVWRLDASVCAARLEGHELPVSSVDCQGSGATARLCSGSRDNTVRVWDVASETCVHTSRVSRNLVTRLKWIPGTTQIVQCGEDKALKIWDERDGLRVVQTFPTDTSIHSCCDISDDGNYVVTSTRGSNGFLGALWDRRQNRCALRFGCNVVCNTSCCLFLPSIAWQNASNAQPLVMTGSDDQFIRLWDCVSGECIKSVRPSQLDFGAGPITSLDATPSGAVYCGTFGAGVQVLGGARHLQEFGETRFDLDLEHVY